MFAPKVGRGQTKSPRTQTGTLAHPRDRDPVEQARVLQRTIGNQATLSYLAHRPNTDNAETGERSWLAESYAGEGPDQEPKEVSGPEGDEAEPEEPEGAEPPGRTPAAESTTTVVSATFTGAGVRHDEHRGALAGAAKAEKREVKPAGTTTYDGTAASSTCLPADILPADVDWDVTDKGRKWGVKVTAFRTSGEIKVNPTPSLPTTVTTPNTPNPVDGGNINNTAGSNNRWKFAIDEMRGYNKRGGGRSRHWHSTAASDAHEYAHWNVDWLKKVVGGLWPRANRDLDRMTIRKASAADAAAARPLLATKVNARIARANRKSTRDWNAVPDEPGMAGANGYKAGQRVLNGLISSVRNYARSKKWT
jgi:hypothetical protein